MIQILIFSWPLRTQRVLFSGGFHIIFKCDFCQDFSRKKTNNFTIPNQAKPYVTSKNYRPRSRVSTSCLYLHGSFVNTYILMCCKQRHSVSWMVYG